jgi:hypothetical protein
MKELEIRRWKSRQVRSNFQFDIEIIFFELVQRNDQEILLHSSQVLSVEAYGIQLTLVIGFPGFEATVLLLLKEPMEYGIGVFH